MDFEYTYLPIWPGGYLLNFTSEQNAFSEPRLLYAIGLGKASSENETEYQVNIYNPDKQVIPAIYEDFWKLQLEAYYDADLNKYILKYTISDNFENSKSFRETLDAKGVVTSIKALRRYAETGTFTDQSIQIKRLNSIIEGLREENQYYLRDQTTKYLEIQQLKMNAEKDQATIQELKRQNKNMTSSLNNIKKIAARKGT